LVKNPGEKQIDLRSNPQSAKRLELAPILVQ
jgi:hypothetical protein